MVMRKPIVLADGVIRELPAGDTIDTGKRELKIWMGVGQSAGAGNWSVSFATDGAFVAGSGPFTEKPFAVIPIANAYGTRAEDVSYPALDPGSVTVSGCSGKVLRSTSAGVLLAMVMVNEPAGRSFTMIAMGY